MYVYEYAVNEGMLCLCMQLHLLRASSRSHNAKKYDTKPSHLQTQS